MSVAACQVLLWVLDDGNVANPENQGPQREPGTSACTGLVENWLGAMCISLSYKRKQNLL